MLYLTIGAGYIVYLTIGTGYVLYLRKGTGYTLYFTIDSGYVLYLTVGTGYVLYLTIDSGYIYIYPHNRIQIHKRFKRTVLIRTRQNQQIFGVIAFFKLQNNT